MSTKSKLFIVSLLVVCMFNPFLKVFGAQKQRSKIHKNIETVLTGRFGKEYAKSIIKIIDFNPSLLSLVKKHLLYHVKNERNHFLLLIEKDGKVSIPGMEKYEQYIRGSTRIDRRVKTPIDRLINRDYIDPAGLIIYNYQPGNPGQKFLFLQADLHVTPWIQIPAYKIFESLITKELNQVVIFREGLSKGRELKINENYKTTQKQGVSDTFLDNLKYSQMEWVDYAKLKHPRLQVKGISDIKLYTLHEEYKRKLFGGRLDCFDKSRELLHLRDNALYTNAIELFRSSDKKFGIVNLGGAHLFQFGYSLNGNIYSQTRNYFDLKDTIHQVISQNRDICMVILRPYNFQNYLLDFQRKIRTGKETREPPPFQSFFGEHERAAYEPAILKERNLQACAAVIREYNRSKITEQFIYHQGLPEVITFTEWNIKKVDQDGIVSGFLYEKVFSRKYTYETLDKYGLIEKTRKINGLNRKGEIYANSSLVVPKFPEDIRLEKKTQLAAKNIEIFHYHNDKSIFGIFAVQLPTYLNIKNKRSTSSPIDSKNSVYWKYSVVRGSWDYLEQLATLNASLESTYPFETTDRVPVNIDLFKISAFDRNFSPADNSILALFKNSPTPGEFKTTLIETFNSLKLSEKGVSKVELAEIIEPSYLNLENGTLNINPNFSLNDLENLTKEQLERVQNQENPYWDTTTVDQGGNETMRLRKSIEDPGKIIFHGKSDAQLFKIQQEKFEEIKKNQEKLWNLWREIWRYFVIRLNTNSRNNVHAA